MNERRKALITAIGAGLLLLAVLLLTPSGRAGSKLDGATPAADSSQSGGSVEDSRIAPGNPPS